MSDPTRRGGAGVGRLDPNGAAARDGMPAASASAAAPAQGRSASVPRAYPYRQPATWWLRRRGYFLYVVREATALPVAVWIVLFLVEVWRLRGGPSGYRPFTSPLFVGVSVVCLIAALWHSFTFLSLAGRIIRIPRREGFVHPRFIVGGMFSLLVAATIVVGGLLVLGGSTK